LPCPKKEKRCPSLWEGGAKKKLEEPEKGKVPELHLDFGQIWIAVLNDDRRLGLIS
jgi:hypothetical protein